MVRVVELPLVAAAADHGSCRDCTRPTVPRCDLAIVGLAVRLDTPPTTMAVTMTIVDVFPSILDVGDTTHPSPFPRERVVSTDVCRRHESRSRVRRGG